MKTRRKNIVSSFVFLEKDGQILLGKRKNSGYMDGYYGIPSGHLEERESIKAAAIRETKEEVGVDIKKEDLEFIYITNHQSLPEDSDRIHIFFKCSQRDGEIQLMEPEKCAGRERFNLDNLPENTVDYVKNIASSLQDSPKFEEIGR